MISYVCMCADILHKGHINILKTANLYGKVIVGLMTDDVMISYKRKPYLSYEDRKAVLENIKYVYQVVPQTTMSFKSNLITYKPNFVVGGDDWKYDKKWFQYRQETIDLLNSWNGKLIEPKYTEGISTTIISNRIKNNK